MECINQSDITNNGETLNMEIKYDPMQKIHRIAFIEIGK